MWSELNYFLTIVLPTCPKRGKTTKSTLDMSKHLSSLKLIFLLVLLAISPLWSVGVSAHLNNSGSQYTGVDNDIEEFSPILNNRGNENHFNCCGERSDSTQSGTSQARPDINWIDGFVAPKVGINLSQNQIDNIILTPKGQRPDPLTYMSKADIDAHLAKFDSGVTKFSASPPSGAVGPPGGTFVMPKAEADQLIKQADGDLHRLEKLLGLNKGDLGSNPVRIDVNKPSGLRMSSGNELGANNYWLPGGKTSGGISEATVDQIKPGSLQVIQSLISEDNYG